ncbi:hypothetical protein DF196_12875 [Bifidobacterium callitrichidarum]|uniref:Uncharacterized protein n=1 Tax=Bifidobacterium callitrichidarum TaxID=2052941 RepID=A0A2U2MYP6_9BIFI|nr:hypothetical protein DF196_12875 [Bifidobacterium callitrichidarum]
MSDNRVPGDARLAHVLWLRRRHGWITVLFISWCLGCVIAGFCVDPFNAFIQGTLHGDMPAGLYKALLFFIWNVVPVVSTSVYLWVRLHGRPDDLLAVRSAWEGIRLVAQPDTTDSDGDPWGSNIDHILFQRDTNRTFTVLTEVEQVPQIAVFTVEDGTIRLDAIHDVTDEQRRAYNDHKTRYQFPWLEPGLDYDSNGHTLLVR